LAKAPTGIAGLDEITGGGLPQGRPTLVCGGPGSGKTLLALQFLVGGALEHGEPGVFIAFEETEEDLAQNMASLGFDLRDLTERGLLVVDYVRVERTELEEAGEYDLEGLFIRIDLAVRSIGATRVAIDTLEVLFSGLSNLAILRAEVSRLFRWLKDRGLTVVVTAETGEGRLTRQGLEEYVSDCVILLEHRVADQLSTRRLRVVKYRGSAHGTNEYPFLIDEHGLSVLPVTSLGLQHAAPTERVSSGIPALDAMMDGGGYFRGSSILVSGTAGAGKSSVAACFAEAACARGERCLYFAFEESPDQIVRNMRSIGLDLRRWLNRGRLRILANRASRYGLETHLAAMHREIERFQPQVAVFDPITNLITLGAPSEVRSMTTRLIDYLKVKGITGLFTSLTAGGENLEHTIAEVSSLVDTWLLLRDIEANGERNRVLHLLKSRGMAHSNQVREFHLTSSGIELVDAYIGAGGVLTGSARAAQEAHERADAVARRQTVYANIRRLERKRQALEAQVAALRAAFDAESAEEQTLIDEAQAREDVLEADRQEMARGRQPSRGRTDAPRKAHRNRA
jgi:circadian clock protein KaiC